MGILANETAKIVVQGITGGETVTFNKDMIAYGSKVVAGVTPGKGGQTVHGVPVFDTVYQAVKEYNAEASIISVPPAMVRGTALEALSNGIKLLVIVAERVPPRDTIEILEVAREDSAVYWT